MKFLTLPIDRVEGALLARPVVRSGLAFAKSRKLSAEDVALLRIVGVEEVAVALIEPGDVGEDEAARRIGERLAGAGLRVARIHGGRCDLAAAAPGLIALAPEQIHALNRIDESITIATLPPLARVATGQIVATVKVNPFAVPEHVVAGWEAAAAPLALRPFAPRRAGLIQTRVAELKVGVLDKTSRSVRQRLELLGGALIAERRVAHDQTAVAQALAEMALAGADLILICGAYSTADREDVVPAAIVEAGGSVACFGMPVEPGNLLLVGALNGADVVGLPGCARALQLNGFDFVLQRLAAGLKVGREDIAAMGVGGLLRQAPPTTPLEEPQMDAPPARSVKKIAAVVLAAGRSSRMGVNKLTLELEGKPVVRHVADAISRSAIAKMVVVLGHEAEAVRAALNGVAAQFVVNADFAEGLSSSLKAGLAGLPADVDGAMIFLGDMPDVDAALIDRMIAHFDPAAMRAIVAPTRNGRQGHPVLWGRSFFAILRAEMRGDSGAKHLLARYADWLAPLATDQDGVLLDLDTPDAFERRRKAT